MLAATFVASPVFPRTGWWVAAALALGIGWYYVHDRQLPITMGTPDAVPEVKAGEEVIFHVPVKRDLSRECTLFISRILLDSQLQRRTILPEQQITPDGLRMRERLSPGKLIIKIVVPQSTPSGVAHILTDARYVCDQNPTTWPIADYVGLGPLQTGFDWIFYVKPPEPAEKGTK